MEKWERGLIQQIANLSTVNSGPQVRILPSPPKEKGVIKMGVEIERKFLCNMFTPPANAEHFYVEQFYLASGNIEVRFHSKKNLTSNEIKYELTLKSSGDLVRKEQNIKITKEDFETAKEMLGDKMPITKDFYVWHFDEARPELFEFSIVDGFWSYFEIEFAKEIDAKVFCLAKWILPNITGIRWFYDVTDNEEYKMKNYWNKTRGKI